MRAGDRFGIMKFGSRMDVFVPLDATLAVDGRRHGARRRNGHRGATLTRTRARDHGQRTAAIPAAHGATGRARRFRRGVYILPTLFTLGNMFCGYACIVYAMRGEFETAAPFIGFAIVLDMLDGRIARMTGSASDFGVEFDSLADVISFGIAPAILSFSWGLQPLGRLGWLAGFLFLTAAAMRLARFNIQSAHGRRQAVLRRHAEPGGGGDPGRDGLRLSVRSDRLSGGAAGAGDGARPGGADGEHDPVPQLQDASICRAAGRTRSCILLAAGIALIATHPRVVLVVLAYSYLASAFIGLAISRLRQRATGPARTRLLTPSRSIRPSATPRACKLQAAVSSRIRRVRSGPI